jgi:hypothetical protein
VGVANPSAGEAYFDLLGVEQDPPLVAEERHRRRAVYNPWGLELVGIALAGSPSHGYLWQGKEREYRQGPRDHPPLQIFNQYDSFTVSSRYLTRKLPGR